MSGYPCSVCRKRWPTRWCPDCQRGPDQPSLFEPDGWGRQGSTPHNPGDDDAAVSESAARAQEATILALVDAAGERGMTCEEVEIASGMRHQTASRALRNLAKGETPALWKSSMKRRNPGSGVTAHVYLRPRVAARLGHERVVVPAIVCPHCGRRVNEE